MSFFVDDYLSSIVERFKDVGYFEDVWFELVVVYCFKLVGCIYVFDFVIVVGVVDLKVEFGEYKWIVECLW